MTKILYLLFILGVTFFSAVKPYIPDGCGVITNEKKFVPAQDLVVGDQVLTCNMKDKRVKTFKEEITKIQRTRSLKYTYIKTDNGKYAAGRLLKYYNPVRKKWIKADKITTSDYLVTSDFEVVEIRAVSNIELYNIINFYHFTLKKGLPFFIHGEKNEAVLVKC